jgi:predicted HicB family RNase H-like nuclease
MVKSDTLNLRVSSEFKRRLMEEAAKEKRSVTNYLEATLAALWDGKNAVAQEKLKKESMRR